MNALQELRRLFSQRSSTRYSASLVTLGDTSAEVSTAAGRRTVRLTTGLSVRVGDRVIVDTGVIIGRARPESETPIYWV